MSESSDKLQVGAYFMLAGGFILSALANIKNARDKALGNVNAHGLGDGVGYSNEKSPGGPRVLRLPSVRLPTQLGKPKLKQYDVKDIDTRVGLIGELIRKGSLSPDLRERTVALLASKCDALGRIDDGAGRFCVAEKDCMGEVKAIFDAIRNPRSKYAVRYTRDAMLADVFVAPERTLLKSHGGDCFVQGTKVLKQEGHALVPIESLREGDSIWGYNKWSRVTKVFGDKGVLKTWLMKLSNGASMRLTPDHKVWIATKDKLGTREVRSILVRELVEGDELIQPKLGLGLEPFNTRQFAPDGLFLSEVVTDGVELPCWDIETEDHFVWLPEADWTVRNCDDFVVTLGSMLMSVGHPVRMRVVATRKEGTPDSKAPWSHIYLLTPTTFDNPNAKWLSVDGSMDKPLGWEAPGAREVAATGKPSGIIARVRDYSLMKPSDAE